MKYIIDISRHNGKIDWDAIAPHIEFAMLKCSEGATVVDPQFVRNVQGCVANGIRWGAYHFATWNSEDETTDAQTEAKHFMRQLALCGHPPSMPVVLDIENNRPIRYTKQEMVEYVSSFLDTLAFAGISLDQMAIYASPGFLAQYMSSDHPFGGIKLWVADYTGGINPVPGWKKPWLHQYTQTGKVPGMKGNVDLNRLV